jgi:hypothetical protein
MTPERKEQLIALREVRDELRELFREARDNWTKACSDLNYALLEEVDYYQYIQKIRPDPPDWLSEVKGGEPTKEVITRKKADALVEQMLKQQQEVKKEGKDASSWKSFW